MKKKNVSVTASELRAELKKNRNEIFSYIDDKSKSLEKRMDTLEKMDHLHILSSNIHVEASLRKIVEAEIRISTDKILSEIKQQIIDFKDLILTTVDPLLQELETRQQDREIASAQSEEFQTKLDEHEKRITKIEKN